MEKILGNFGLPVRYAVLGGVFGLLAYLALSFLDATGKPGFVGLVIGPAVAGCFGGLMKQRRDKEK